MNDLRHALRQLLRNPGFTAVVVLTLALGIGANTAIFSVVNAVLLQPLPYREPGRLVTVCERNAGRGFDQLTASGANFFAWREQAASFEGLAAEVFASFNLTGTDQPAHVHGAQVSANYFSLLGAPFLLGRGFAGDEDQPGKNYLVVLAHGFWQSHFGSDPRIVGQTIALNGVRFTVTGVLAPQFRVFNPRSVSGRSPVSFEPVVWIPCEFSQAERQGQARYYLVWGRLKPGVTVAAAQAEMTALSARLQESNPITNRGWTSVVKSIHEQVTHESRPILLLLLGAVGFVVLIACANVANLHLARGIGRQRELAVRAALGAKLPRLARLLLTESTLLALAGGALGLLMARGLIETIPWLAPPQMPRLEAARLDGWALGFTFLLSLLAGAVSGLAPLLQVWRLAPNAALKSGGRGMSESRTERRTRAGLVVVQVALALMLLAGATLLARSFQRLTGVNPGFRAQKLLALDLSLPDDQRYNQESARIDLANALQQRVGQLAGVESAAVMHGLPFGSMLMSLKRMEIEGRPQNPGDPPVSASYRQASPRYFTTMGIPIVRGREFTPQDNTNSPRVVIINEAFARQHFGTANPVGKRMRGGATGTNFAEIVGVAGDVKLTRLDDAPRPEVYLSQLQSSVWMFSVVARVTGDPAATARQIQQAVQALDPNLPAYNVRILDNDIAVTTAPRRFATLLMGCFGGLALVLAAVGLYGVLTCGVRQREQELGIRMALGAGASDILGLVLRHGLFLLLLGSLVGLAGSLALGRVLGNQLFEIPATDSASLAVAMLVLAIVTIIACWLPAHRAAKVDPMVALRAE